MGKILEKGNVIHQDEEYLGRMLEIASSNDSWEKKTGDGSMARPENASKSLVIRERQRNTVLSMVS